MDSKRFVITQWLSRILLIAIIIFSGLVMYAINEIDKIINGNLYGQMYHYGLEFSLDWANPYWSFTKIVYIGLGATIIISIIVLLLGFIKTKKPETSFKQEPQKTQPPTLTQPQPQPVYTQPKPKIQTPPTPKAVIQPQTKTQPQPETVEEQKPKNTTKPNSAIPNTCPSCKKTFGQPLVMLDFEGGKSKLVNVCPYCNQVLGDTEQKE